MGKTRVYKVAQDIGIGKDELVEKINAMNLGFAVKNHMSEITDEQAASVRKAMEREQRRAVVQQQAEDRSGSVMIRRRPGRKRGGGGDGDGAESAEPSRAASVEPVREPVEAQAVSGDNGQTHGEEPARHVGVHIRRRARVSAAPAEAMPVTAPVAKKATRAEPEEEPAAPLEVEEPTAAESLEVQTEAATQIAEELVARTPSAEDVESPPVAAAQGDEEGDEEVVAASAPELDLGEDEDDIEAIVPNAARVVGAADDARAVRAARKRPKPAASNIVGSIDPEVIRARLAVDRKVFAPGPVKPERPAAKEKKPAGRKVVDSRALYPAGGGAAGARRRPSRKGRGRSKGGVVERTQITQAAEHKRVLQIADVITVGDLAHSMGVKSSEVIKFLMGQGMMVTMNQAVDIDTAELIAENFGFTVEDVSFREETYLTGEVDREEDLELRAPVVTVMGHVDHGKTSLLDAIRHTHVAAGEAGGITQHIGASTVTTESGNRVVFLDTPGHEAFTALRARGAKVTDLVVLVVAADDGVMPQTVEAINHARAAGVPIIVAVNKIDKPGANPQRVKQALTEYELVPEEWGGSTIFVEVSALAGTNIQDLIEMIQIQSEVLELRANPGKPARGVVLEAYKHSGRGTVATVIVQEGTLKQGDIVVSGAKYGRVRTMTNERGQELAVAGPSTPVEITGLSDVPDAGEAFFVAEDEKVAREFTETIGQRRRQSELAARKVDPWAALKDTKKLHIIIKGDVQGSVEALAQSLEKLSVEAVKVDIIHTGVGGITESDVQLAIASQALVIGFNIRPEVRANELAKREGVPFELHSVIYDVIDRVRTAMTGLLDPIYEERALGRAEVRETFSVPKIGTIAGCYVLDGRIVRGAQARLVRDGKVIYESRIGSLRRFKDDVKEVKSGFECGLSVENYNDVKVGDIVEAFEMEAVAATLASH